MRKIFTAVCILLALASSSFASIPSKTVPQENRRTRIDPLRVDEFLEALEILYRKAVTAEERRRMERIFRIQDVNFWFGFYGEKN